MDSWGTVLMNIIPLFCTKLKGLALVVLRNNISIGGWGSPKQPRLYIKACRFPCYMVYNGGIRVNGEFENGLN